MAEFPESVAGIFLAAALAKAQDSDSRSVSDTYGVLRASIVRKLGKEDVVRLIEDNPRSKGVQVLLSEELEQAGVTTDPELTDNSGKLRAALLSARRANDSRRDDGDAGGRSGTNNTNRSREATNPTRGPLRLEVSSSTPVMTGGTDFSIFVSISNPFDVPVTVYQVLTHIPIELIDRNTARLVKVQSEIAGGAAVFSDSSQIALWTASSRPSLLRGSP